MAEDTRKCIRRKFIGVQGKFFGRSRFAQPLHVVLNEDLENFTVDAAPALERPPGAPACGHVRTKSHCTKFTLGEPDPGCIRFMILSCHDSVGCFLDTVVTSMTECQER